MSKISRSILKGKTSTDSNSDKLSTPRIETELRFHQETKLRTSYDYRKTFQIFIKWISQSNEWGYNDTENRSKYNSTQIHRVENEICVMLVWYDSTCIYRYKYIRIYI